MKQRISALMDGELDHDSAVDVITKLKQHAELRREWWTYHLIGDALRQSIVFSTDLTQKLSEKLSAEPTVVSPRRSVTHKVKVVVLSAAASLAAVAMVAWVTLQNTPDKGPEQIAAAKPAAPASEPANVPASGKLNDYLIAHQEYSPSTLMQGVAPYVRTVADSQRETER